MSKSAIPRLRMKAHCGGCVPKAIAGGENASREVRDASQGETGVSIIWMVNAALVDFAADATRSAGGPRRPNAARALCKERLT